MSKLSMPWQNKTDKNALQEWEDLLQSIRDSTPVDANETEDAKRKRIKRLEAAGNEEEWIKYYFPKYCFCEPADFQIKSFKKILKAVKAFFQRRAWFRGASKSTRRMFEIMYLMFAKKFRVNALLISKSNDNAVRLLGAYMAELEANKRLINDYGLQEKAGSWSQGDFKTRKGSSFRAVGAEQNPRGAKDQELRINTIIFDDVDDDEVCRNPERLQQRQQWIEQAVIPTVDISAMYYIFFDNNIIAEDSLAMKAAAFANDVETVNIRDANGKSTWPQKNSEEDIDAILDKISYESGQKEYFNNPITQGKTFPEITYGNCPPLKELDFVIVYADPSPSNRDRPTIKSNAQNSCKAVVVVGCKAGIYYLYKCWVDITTNANFVDWLFAAQAYCTAAKQSYIYIENNTLQNPHYEQVLMPLIFEKSVEYGIDLLITPDAEPKADKWFRIEGTLEPINRLGRLLFNVAEKENKNMQRMEAQFKGASPNSRTLDGPDAVQGAVAITKIKNLVTTPDSIHVIKRQLNNKRY